VYGYVGLVAIGGIVSFGLVLTMRRPKPQPPAFRYPERETDMRIVVPTSDERALRETLGEFGVSYGAKDFASNGAALRASDGRFVVRFPHGLRADMFLYLVNFLHYPFNGPGFAGAYGVATVATALEGLGLPDALGTVVVFVPDDDEEHDAVWLRSAADETWHCSFRATSSPEPVGSRGPSYRDYWLA
jgi:hypothetical protein